MTRELEIEGDLDPILHGESRQANVNLKFMRGKIHDGQKGNK